MSTPANSINETTTGICGFTGSAFTGSAVSQYNLIVGSSTSSTLSQVTNGASQTQLSSGGASANPSYKSFTIVQQNFAASGTYTPTSGMVYCIVEVQGAGGGGGGIINSGASNANAGGGGSSGAYARGAFSAATIGANQTITIDTGGAAGSSSGGTGGDAGDTTFGSLITCPGGLGGTGGSTSVDAFCALPGGAAAIATGSAQLNLRGNPGHAGIGVWNAAAAAGYINGGTGGSGVIYASQGGKGRGLAATGQNIAGIGGLYGGGGSGAAGAGNVAGVTGGAGGTGYIVVTEFVWS